MSIIKDNFAEGGANLVPAGAAGFPTLAEALGEIADDLAAIKLTEILSDDATEINSAITLVNEIKAAINVLAAYTIKTARG